jgi:hypothetical protein
MMPIKSASLPTIREKRRLNLNETCRVINCRLPHLKLNVANDRFCSARGPHIASGSNLRQPTTHKYVDQDSMWQRGIEKNYMQPIISFILKVRLTGTSSA